MVKKIFLILFIITIILPKDKIQQNTPTRKDISEDIIGKIIIPKINLEKSLYKVESKNNTIEKNVEILKESTFPTEKNSLMIIAAHSGSGKIAFFNELNKLKEKDEVFLIINNIKYKYEVKEIWEEEKNGYINLNIEKEKQLILTTCSPTKNNYQLIVNCIEKDVLD